MFFSEYKMCSVKIIQNNVNLQINLQINQKSDEIENNDTSDKNGSNDENVENSEKEDDDNDTNEYISLFILSIRNITCNSYNDIESFEKKNNGLIALDLMLINHKTPKILIEYQKDYKYKKVIRDYCLNILKNKDIKSIKHLNNIDNFHNYVVLLDNHSKNIYKYKNYNNCLDKNKILWKTNFLYDNCYSMSEINKYLCLNINNFI